MATNPHPKYQHLERSIGYQFVNSAYLTQALTHRSKENQKNYERLEFLGDALLGMVIAEYLYHTYDQIDEGRLSRMRATLVRQDALAKIAHQHQLSSSLILGIGELKGGGHKRASILSDTVEAIIGAIYLDSGSIEVTRHCILTWYQSQFKNIDDTKVLKDAKSRLQELLQAKGCALPTYQLDRVEGQAPNERFFVIVTAANIDNQHYHAKAQGSNRRIAEQRAAEKLVTELTTVFNSN